LTNLKKKGEVINVRRGVWRITDKGRERIKHTGGTKLSEISQPKITVIGFGPDACFTIANIALEDKLDMKLVAVDTQIEIDRITGESRTWHSKGSSIGVETPEGLIFAPTLRREKIEKISRGSDLVFLLGDMRDSEVLDSVPKVNAIMGSFEALTIGIFRLPDASVDTDHLRVMDECMQDLRETLDAWITVPYNPLLNELGVSRLRKNVFRYGIKDIVELVTVPGAINIDISDLRNVLKNAGPTYMSIGTGYGEAGWAKAYLDVLHNHFLDISSPKGAKRILLKIISGYHLTLKVVNDIVDYIKRYAANDAEVMFGVTLDPSYNQMTKIIMLASDLPPLGK